MSSPSHLKAGNRGIASHPRVRHESHSRVSLVAERDRLSTMPPRPLPVHADLAPLEWWLDAHMNVVSNLVCLEPWAGGEGPASALFVSLGELRDALYELYCDCGDPRLGELQGRGSPLAAYVSGLYALCDETHETLTAASGLRGLAEISQWATDWKTRRAAFIEATGDLPARVAAALASIEVDPMDPADPLRSVGERLQGVVRAADDVLRIELG
jgi:hypothetical protein